MTAYLFQLIAQQVDDRGPVVWYEPNRAYGAAIADFRLRNTAVTSNGGLAA